MNDSELFITAVQIEDPLVRAALLDSVCNGNSEQRQRIENRIAKYGKWQGAWDNFSSKIAERFIQSINDPVSGFSSNAAQLEAISSPKIMGATYRPGTRVGAYEIKRCLGVGGMGEVYLASDDRLDRNVALKILPLRYIHTPQWIHRFEREGRAASALNHPNIMTIYEIGREEGNHFIASEFVDGQTLRSLVGQELPIAKKLDIVVQIAEALNAAHASNIIHRDIKPENVMMRCDGLVKVLDFGIAKVYSPFSSSREKVTSQSETEPGLMMGTIRYMSPEQARRMAVDFRTDLFSMGVVVFELLTHALPFKSMDDTRILTTLMSDESLQLNKLSQAVPNELEWIIRKLLRKDREERYQSAKELVVDLKQVRRQLDRPLKSPRSSLTHSDDEGSERATATEMDWPVEPEIEIPEVRYARSGEVNIAYQIMGGGNNVN